MCKNYEEMPGCKWFSFELQSNTCILLEKCPEIEGNDQYVSSQVECEYSIMSKFISKN